MKMIRVRKHLKGIFAFVMALAITITSISFGGLGYNVKTKAAGEFPATGVHTGTLSHGSYYGLIDLYNSVSSDVIEADNMTSNGEKRACFCLSPGVSETTKANAYKSANYTSGYGIKYYKALMQFYYDKKDDYKDNAIRFATGIFVWRTVVLERSHKGNFVASDYNANGFKNGFLASMKSIFGYSDSTANNIYDKAYDYIKEGANGKHNDSWALLKWTASASQTMLTGKKVPAPKSVKIKINKDLDESGSGITLSGTKYVLRKGSASGDKVATFSLDSDGLDSIEISHKADYTSTVKYYICESENVGGTISNKNNNPIEFSIDWSKVSGYGGQAYIKKNGLETSKNWFIKGTSFNTRCKGQLEEQLAKGYVSITKESATNGKKLSGAEFTIYAYNKDSKKYELLTKNNNKNENITNPIVTNANGVAKSDTIWYTKKNQGCFIIKETKAPSGFDNSYESKKFTIKNGNGVIDNNLNYGKKFVDSEHIYNARLSLAKSDMDTNDPIFDAEFTLYEGYDDRTGKPAKIADAIDFKWKPNGQKLEQLKDKETGELTNTYTSGLLSSDRTYQLRETKRPKSHYSINDSSGGGGMSELGWNTLADYDKGDYNYYANIEVVGDNTIKVLNSNMRELETLENNATLEVHNRTVFGSLKVIKVDKDNPNIKLKGASFELWEARSEIQNSNISKERFESSDYIPSAEQGDIIVNNGVTDENGELYFGNLVAERYYYLVETKPAEGYYLPEKKVTPIYASAEDAVMTSGNFEFAFEKTIPNEKAYIDLSIHKVSVSRTGKESVALKGAKFALYKVEKIVTDPDALSDDQLDQDDTDNDGISDDTEDAISEDTEITENDVDDGSLTNMNYINYDYSKLEPIKANIETDENGNAIVDKALEAGGYVLVELEAPKNYKVAEPQYIFVDTEKLYSATPYEVEVEDDEFEAEVKCVKRDIETGKVIKASGVGFKIKNLDTDTYVTQTVDTYAKPKVKGAPHDLIKSEETDIFYTDETGTVTLPNVLPVGNFQMEEHVAPLGYTLDPVPVKFKIDDEMDLYPDDPTRLYDYDENTREIVVPINSNDHPTTVEITKAKLSDKEELEGAKLKVVDKATGKTVESWTSTKTAHVIKALEIGKTYTLVETKPADGFVTAESIDFTVKDTNEVQKVVMYDDITRQQDKKTDITTGKPVIGAKLEILDKDGNVFDSWVTTKEEHLIEKIPVGEWILRETYAPNSYVTAKDIKFTVKDTGEIQTVEMKDDYTHIKLIKVEKNTNKRLNGATFSVKDSNGKIVANITTSSNGSAKINKKLKVGKTYKFTELSAPSGYKVAKPVTYKVKDTADTQIVKIEDEPIFKAPKSSSVYNAPKTGGNAFPIWYIVGIVASLILLVVGFIRIRRRKKVTN